MIKKWPKWKYYKNKMTGKKYKLSVMIYEEIPIESMYIEEKEYKIVELLCDNVIFRSFMTKNHILIANKKGRHLMLKTDFDQLFEAVAI